MLFTGLVRRRPSRALLRLYSSPNAAPNIEGTNKNSSGNNTDGSDGPNRDVKKVRWWSISGQIERLLIRIKMTDDHDTARLIGKSTSIAFFSLLGMTALGTMGVDTSPLLTGIGVTGFTLGFALKEIATNFLSGMMLVFSRPFRKGQNLRVMVPSMQGIEGEVLSIDARYVLLRPKTGGTIMIPSVIVYTSPFYVSSITSNINAASVANTAPTTFNEHHIRT